MIPFSSRLQSAFFYPPEMCLCPRFLDISALDRGPFWRKFNNTWQLQQLLLEECNLYDILHLL